MSDPEETRSDGVPGTDPVRRATLRGAVLAILLVFLVALLRGYGDVWLVLAAVMALALSAALGGTAASSEP